MRVTEEIRHAVTRIQVDIFLMNILLFLILKVIFYIKIIYIHEVLQAFSYFLKSTIQ